MPKKKRKKYPKLPAGFGSIRYLGVNRRNCYAVHPPASVNSLGKTVRPAAICYVDDWIKGFTVLTAYKAGTYHPGMERELQVSPTADADALIGRIIADYNMIKGVEDKHPEIKKLTFSEVYDQFMAWKFASGTSFSSKSRTNYTTAYSYCKEMYNHPFVDLKATDFQDFLDNQTGLKKGSMSKILTLFKQMYKYAIFAEISTENKAQFVRVNAPDDEEHGTPFTDEELQILWNNADDYDVQLVLIMCYSGWRIGELSGLSINLKEKYYEGGIKTKAGKGRIVPIHSSVYPFVQSRIEKDGALLTIAAKSYRDDVFYSLMDRLKTTGDPKHTPHDCRHTFSTLCERYSMRENDRKRMLGHAFNGDITNSVYGHRTVDELRIEIEKIQNPFVTNCD